MYEELKKRTYQANVDLYMSGLDLFSGVSVSECDRACGIFCVRPEGIPIDSLSPEQMVILSMEGRKVDGDFIAVEDALTHAALYRRFFNIAGVAHMHSMNAVSFANAGYPLPAYGVDHAGFAKGAIPCTRKLSDTEVLHDYEFNIAKTIIEAVRKDETTNENNIPGALVRSHGAYTWGTSAKDAAAKNIKLETLAEIAVRTLLVKNLALKNDRCSIQESLLKKYYSVNEPVGEFLPGSAI